MARKSKALAVVSPVPVAGLAAPERLDTEGAARLYRAFLTGRGEHTRRAYAQDMADFASFVARHEHLAGCTSADALALLLARGHGPANLLALDYRADLLGRKLASGTASRRLYSLRSAVKLARMLGMVPWVLEVPAVKVERYKDTSGPGVAGVQAMADVVRARGDAKGTRDRALLALLFARGLRRGELVSLDMEHVDLAHARLHVLGKGRTEREWVTVPEEALEALRAWLAVRPGEPLGPVFLSFDATTTKAGGRLSGTGIYKVVRAYGVKALGPGAVVRPHGLRHAGVTALLDAGETPRNVQRFARHRDLRVLRFYDDNRQDLGGAASRKLAALVRL